MRPAQQKYLSQRLREVTYELMKPEYAQVEDLIRAYDDGDYAVVHDGHGRFSVTFPTVEGSRDAIKAHNNAVRKESQRIMDVIMLGGDEDALHLLESFANFQGEAH